MARYGNSATSGAMGAALGSMIGLVVGLFAFDKVADTIIPKIYNCAGGFTANTSAQECQNLSAPTALTDPANDTIQKSVSGYFADAIILTQDLLAPVGILAAFGIIWFTLKSMKLV